MTFWATLGSQARNNNNDTLRTLTKKNVKSKKIIVLYFFLPFTLKSENLILFYINSLLTTWNLF